MKSKQVYYSVKNLYTGLFWCGNKKQWILPQDRLDVFSVAISDENDRLLSINEDWENELKNIPEHFHIDCILSTITVETNIIF